MKLLIVTQKVSANDHNLGFFHRWIIEFAKHYEQVIVVALEVGQYDLPSNVRVISLGKEVGRSRLKYLGCFYKAIWSERKNYDSVFVHMNQIYVILGGWLWRMWHKKIGLWYVHRQVSFSLRLAEQVANVIFTTSPESFRVRSKKVVYTGHGIDTDLFKPVSESKPVSSGLRLLSVSRISATKDQLKMIDLVEELRKNNMAATLSVVGEPITSADKKYLAKLKKVVEEKSLVGAVSFLGAITQADLPRVYNSHDIFLNLSETGSVDKAVLEAMACGIKVYTTNSAFDFSIAGHQFNQDEISVAKFTALLNRPDQGEANRQFVVENHSLQKLIPKIVTNLEWRHE